MTAATTIAGLTVTPLRQIVDDRGAVLHMLRADEPEFGPFGECYFSQINPGIIKAWKRHRLQSQNIAVPVGRVRVVVFDEREQSPTKGMLDMVELGRPDNYVRMRIPPLLWYGFKCIATQPSLIANCVDTPHSPEESEVLGLEMLKQKRALNLLRDGSGRC